MRNSASGVKPEKDHELWPDGNDFRPSFTLLSVTLQYEKGTVCSAGSLGGTTPAFASLAKKSGRSRPAISFTGSTMNSARVKLLSCIRHKVAACSYALREPMGDSTDTAMYTSPGSVTMGASDHTGNVS